MIMLTHQLGVQKHAISNNEIHLSLIDVTILESYFDDVEITEPFKNYIRLFELIHTTFLGNDIECIDGLEFS